MADRNYLFLSHATPEDNAFATWLGAKLAEAGYEVWSDILKLGGGETFWDDCPRISVECRAGLPNCRSSYIRRATLVVLVDRPGKR